MVDTYLRIVRVAPAALGLSLVLAACGQRSDPADTAVVRETTTTIQEPMADPMLADPAMTTQPMTDPVTGQPMTDPMMDPMVADPMAPGAPGTTTPPAGTGTAPPPM